MKKLILLLSIFLLSFGNINAQSGFVANRYYQQRYNITTQKKSCNYNNTYYDVDQFGKIHYFEWWRKAKWYSYQGNTTYYVWQYNGYNYQWISYNEWGTYWYYQWYDYKRYYYFYNGSKYYKN